MEQSPPTGVIASHMAVVNGMAWECLSGGSEAPGSGYAMWCCLSGSLLDQILHGAKRLYQGMLIRCKNYRVDYACPFCGVAVLGSDGMGSRTQVWWHFLCGRNCQCSTSPGVFSMYHIYIFPREEVHLSCLSYSFFIPNQVLIVCMTHNQLFHIYGQKCS
jgi:hypothetical protein